MNRDKYLKLCNEFDPAIHELWVKGVTFDTKSSFNDPLKSGDWNLGQTYYLKNKARKLGQWVFDDLPDDVDFVAMDDDGQWHYYFICIGEDGCWEYEIRYFDGSGIEKIYWQDSLLKKV